MRILFILMGALLFASCKQKKNKEVEEVCVSVISDTTDRLLATIEADPILRFYQLDQNPSIEAWFRFKVIANVQLVPVTEHHLLSESAMQTNGEPQYRNRKIVGFYNDVRNTIKEFTAAAKTAKELSNSECFYSISEELIYLSNKDYGKKILIIYSDLFERSFLNFYTEQLNPKEIADSLQKAHPLPNNLSGIRVYVIFNPGSVRSTDLRFRQVFKAYKLLLEERRAQIFAQASAHNFLSN